jgi:4-hydroxy-tetrahydrodipicolinate synthase
MRSVEGIVPVLLTPFTPDDKIDWDGYEALLEWCIEHGSQGLFAVCQSSEMQFLTLDERVELARFTAKKVAGRVPVVASGHISDDLEDQKTELRAVAETGVDGVVLVTNRLGAQDDDGTVVRARLEALMSAVPSEMPLGLYECPSPFRRLLTDDEVKFCAQSGRFSILKDVSCDLEVLKRRIALTKGTPLSINNANAALAWPALQAGGKGFCGVMNNFHPDLYRWLQDSGAEHPDLVEELVHFLALSAMCETMGYPKIAKLFHKRIGTFSYAGSRAVPYDIREKFWALDAVLDHIVDGANGFRNRISLLKDAA